MVIVDSDVWSLALRRRQAQPHPHVARLEQLIDTGEVLIIGIIRQEVLSGIRSSAQFETIRNRLRAYPDQPVSSDLHELASRFFDHCRAKGVQGSHTDFLICACAASWNAAILSTDKDFVSYAKHLPIELDSV